MIIKILRDNKSFLIGLFVLSFLVRAAVFIGYLGKNENYWQVDSNTYHIIATQIADGKGISSAQGASNFYRLPGYPIFLALYYKVFGVDKKNVLWLQIFFAAFIPLLIFFLSIALFPKNLLLAKASGLYSAVHLGLTLYSGFFMTESIFIFLFLIFVILFLISTHASLIFCSGLALGLASMVRPVGHYLIALAILLICFTNVALKSKIKNILFISFGWLIPVAFWLIRNYILAGALFFHTLPGGHFLYLSASRVAMHVHNCSYQKARTILKDEVDNLIKQKEVEKGDSLSEIEKCELHEGLAVKYFKMRPLLALKNWLTDMMRTSLSLYFAEILYIESGHQEFDYFNKCRSATSMFKRYLSPQTDKFWLKLLIWLEILLYLLTLIGFFAGALKILVQSIKNWTDENKNTLRTWGISAPFIALFIIVALSGGYARMRLPIEPFLIIFSLSFWIPLICKSKN